MNNIKEQIRAEIERQAENYQDTYTDMMRDILLKFIDSLPDNQPIDGNKMIEEAAEKKYPVYWKEYPKDGIARSESFYDTNAQCRDSFIAGAKWQREQMMKEAIEGEISLINVGDDSYVKTLRMSELRKAIQNRNLCCGKVKVIITKDDGRED